MGLCTHKNPEWLHKIDEQSRYTHTHTHTAYRMRLARETHREIGERGALHNGSAGIEALPGR